MPANKYLIFKQLSIFYSLQSVRKRTLCLNLRKGKMDFLALIFL